MPRLRIWRYSDGAVAVLSPGVRIWGYPDELEVIMPFVSRKILEFKTWSKEENEGTLIGASLATQGQLQKLKAAEIFIDSNGQRWWKYRNE
jgi:hypothetical protein